MDKPKSLLQYLPEGMTLLTGLSAILGAVDYLSQHLAARPNESSISLMLYMAAQTRCLRDP